jgi:acetyl/propionyl-CoA carboxylase alpha subunit
MRRALRELQIEGVRTTQPFHLAVLEEPDFGAGDISIRYLERHPALTDPGADGWHGRAAAVAATLLEHRSDVRDPSAGPPPGPVSSEMSAWRRQFAGWE